MPQATTYFPFEPSLKISDLDFFGKGSWDRVDDLLSELLGYPALGIPSIRVGLCWALEFLNLSRNRDQILVPKFMGRCILNSVSRYALPTEVPTETTRATIIVDQFGLKQNKSVFNECGRRNYICLEDSPYGLGEKEAPARESLARFIGLGKILPIVQGGAMISFKEEFVRFIKKKRIEKSRWSFPLWLFMASLRRRRKVGNYSQVAEAVYELYVAGKGGNRWLRGNIVRVLKKWREIATEQSSRLLFLRDHLGNNILIPDLTRLCYLVPCFVNSEEDTISTLFREKGFDSNGYHVDVKRNLFSPEYRKVWLIPLNPRIPRQKFKDLVLGIKNIHAHRNKVTNKDLYHMTYQSKEAL